MADDDDPSAIRSLAVSPEDVVNAFAYGQENPGDAVLRVTPPFHGRMRARIHVYHVDDTHLTGAVHLSPEDVLADEILEAYPRLEDERRNSKSDETERLRRRHAEAIEAWQERARGAIVETALIDTDDGPQRVDLKRIG
jgi:hypothetical protein